MRHKRWRSTLTSWITILLAFALLLVSGALLWKPPALSLRASAIRDQVRLEWDGTTKAVGLAQSGRMEIVDGSEMIWMELNRNQLRGGSLTYARRSAAIVVRLMLDIPGQRRVEAVTHFVGSPLAARANPSPAPDPNTDLRSQLAEQSREADRLEQSISQIQTEVARTPRPEPPRRIARAFVPPARPRVATAAEIDPAVPHPNLGTSLPHISAALAIPSPPAEPRRGSSSGKIIWTGRAPRRGVIEIDTARASVGYLKGGLPGVPVNVRVYAAELNSAGLRLFARDPRHANRPAEPAGPQNGWNRTAYAWDPEHAADLSLLETPGPQNGWKRLVLRAETRPQSVVVVEWEALDGSKP